MTATSQPHRWLPALSLRLRLLGWALLLLAVATLASVVVIRQVLLNQLENRVTAELRQEAAEFRRLAEGWTRPPASRSGPMSPPSPTPT
jgi:two-component system, OmpR family, sensor kinase